MVRWELYINTDLEAAVRSLPRLGCTNMSVLNTSRDLFRDTPIYPSKNPCHRYRYLHLSFRKKTQWKVDEQEVQALVLAHGNHRVLGSLVWTAATNRGIFQAGTYPS